MPFPRTVLPALMVFACGACSGELVRTSASEPSTQADAGVDAAPSPRAEPQDAGQPETGTKLFPADTRTVVAWTPGGGGFEPTPPPGSTCAPRKARHELDLATRSYHFERCVSTGAGPFTTKTGTLVLDEKEVATVVAAMKALVDTRIGGGCGADKDELMVSITTPSKTATYYDSFYACQGGGRTYVDEIDGVFKAFDALHGVED